MLLQLSFEISILTRRVVAWKTLSLQLRLWMKLEREWILDGSKRESVTKSLGSHIYCANFAVVCTTITR